MLDAFYTAIYRLKTIDEILTINRYSYGDIDIDEGTQLIIGTEIDTITLFYDGHIKITYNDKESICSRYNKIQEAISGLMEEIGQAKNEFEKEFLIHEYVVDTVSFSEKDDSTQSVYSALTKQDVTSEYGYACTQKYLLNKVGIECEIVHLTYGGAALNIVKIDGKYYYVNVWGNRGCRYESGGGSHKYFNLTTAQVKAYGYHFNEEEYPEANDEKYSSILGDVFNGMYYNNSLHYLKIMNTESMSGGYAIVRYDMDKESEKILVDSTKHYINSFTINKETQCVEYVTSTGKVCEVSIYGEIPEATKEFVEMIYRKSIKRQATESEILFWSGELYNETKTVAQLVIELMNHQEFQQRKLSDREYVECLYDVLFDKKDNENLEYWVEQLQKGSTRTYVLAKLCEMSEFIELCNSYGLEAGSIELERSIDKYNTITQFIHRFYGTCMNRLPDEEGIIYWVDELSEGTKSVQEGGH